MSDEPLAADNKRPATIESERTVAEHGLTFSVWTVCRQPFGKQRVI